MFFDLYVQLAGPLTDSEEAAVDEAWDSNVLYCWIEDDKEHSLSIYAEASSLDETITDTHTILKDLGISYDSVVCVKVGTELSEVSVLGHSLLSLASQIIGGDVVAISEAETLINRFMTPHDDYRFVL